MFVVAIKMLNVWMPLLRNAMGTLVRNVVVLVIVPISQEKKFVALLDVSNVFMVIILLALVAH